ncbi:MAG: hypothetical protein DRP64_21035 [Verrucomicrobia bacterium]|nr:MAG: hypothetical protein DRP64_21035 [Verrucomicrobiota bacterium]
MGKKYMDQELGAWVSDGDTSGPLEPEQRRAMDKHFGNTPEERKENAKDLVDDFGAEKMAPSKLFPELLETIDKSDFEYGYKYQHLAIEAELLGSVVLFEDAIKGVHAGLLPSDFAAPDYSRIWEVIKQHQSDGKPLDTTSVCGCLASEDADALEEATSYAVTGGKAHAKMRSRQIIKKSVDRELNSLVQNLDTSMTGDVVGQANEAITKAKSRIEGLNIEASKARDTKYRMDQVLDEIDKAAKGEGLGHKTGIADLDRVTGGFRPGSVWIVAAETSVGKSTAVMQMAANVARAGGDAVLVSLEMPIVELAKRELASATGISTTAITSGKMTADQHLRITRAASVLTKDLGSHLRVVDNFSSDIASIITGLQELHHQGNVDVVVVDYIHKIHAGRALAKHVNRNLELEYIVNKFSEFALATDVTVVLVAQLNRLQAGIVRPPTLARLRDSGSLEQSADVVLFLHREKVEDKERHFSVAKNRQGALSVWTMYLDVDRMGFFPLIGGAL